MTAGWRKFIANPALPLRDWQIDVGGMQESCIDNFIQLICIYSCTEIFFAIIAFGAEYFSYFGARFMHPLFRSFALFIVLSACVTSSVRAHFSLKQPAH